MPEIKPSSVSIAFIGVGRMGARMATRLLGLEFRVKVYDLSKQAVDTLVERGASAAQTIPEAARGADFIFLSLPAPGDVRAVVAGEGGVSTSAKPGAVVIDFSTIDATTARQMGEVGNAASISYIDAPVSGGVAAAEAGALTMMVGAEPEAFTTAEPVLRFLASRIIHMGPPGAAQMAKLCNNMLTAINTVAIGEVLTAGVEAGLDLQTLVEVLKVSSGGSNILNWFPKTLFSVERPANFALDLMHKDISLFLQERDAKMPPLPVSQATKQIYSIAKGQGLGRKDSSSVCEFYELLAGVRLQLPPQQTND